MSTNTSPVVPEDTETPQARFNRLYITSAEVCTCMRVTRPAVMRARRCGLLPYAIEVLEGQLYIWERAKVQPYLDAWALVLHTRRNHNAAQHATT